MYIAEETRKYYSYIKRHITDAKHAIMQCIYFYLTESEVYNIEVPHVNVKRKIYSYK